MPLENPIYNQGAYIDAQGNEQYGVDPVALEAWYAQEVAAGRGGPGQSTNPQQPQVQPQVQPQPVPQQPTSQNNIPFREGLNAEQIKSISDLILAKPDTTTWSPQDITNWNYATNNALLPGQTPAPVAPAPTPATPQAPQPASSMVSTARTFAGLTPQQIQELDVAAQRVTAGTPGTEDQKNLDYAASQYGYTPPEGMGEAPEVDPVQAILDQYKKYGLETPDPNANPYDEYYKAYKKVYDELGLTTVKGQIDSLNKEIKALQDKKNEEIADVNDNPWLTEGIRLRQIAKIEKKYSDETGTLTNQFNLYQSLFEKGVEEARFIANKGMELNQNAQSMGQDLVFKAIDMAQKAADAEAKDGKENYSRYKSLNGGLYDLDTQTWLVPPKASGGGGGGGSTAVTNNDRVNEINQYLIDQNLFGDDGLVSWETYLAMKQTWINNGGTESSFRYNYPIDQYLDEQNQSEYNDNLS